MDCYRVTVSVGQVVGGCSVCGACSVCGVCSVCGICSGCSVCGVHVPSCYCVNRSFSTFCFLSSVQSSSFLPHSISEPTPLIPKYNFHPSSLLISAELCSPIWQLAEPSHCFIAGLSLQTLMVTSCAARFNIQQF